ncbi:MAG TPA: hypothetical protein VML91_07270 [Burkholderiales bacterium]|nr:hypothetical protein [Burkholderiales bacterium]
MGFARTLMFIGHYAVAFAAKRAVPAVSLGTLFLAAQLIDGLWPLFLLLGLEHVEIAPGDTAFTPLRFVDYPITHSLLMCAVWAVLLGAAYYLVRRYRAGAMMVGALVMSHWVLDFVTHRPDLPLYPGGRAYAGLGLWNSVPATLAIEGAMFVGGLSLYLAATRARDRTGVVALWGLVLVLLAAYLGAAFGPPAPSPQAVAWSGLLGWLTVLWGYWIDRHRTALHAPAPSA